MHSYNLRSTAPHLLKLPDLFLEDVCKRLNPLDLFAFSITCKDVSWFVRKMKIKVEEIDVYFTDREIALTVFKDNERIEIRMFNYFKNPKQVPHPEPLHRHLTVSHHADSTTFRSCWKMEGFGFQFFLRRLKSVNHAPVINVTFTHIKRSESRHIMSALLEFKLGSVNLCVSTLKEVGIFLKRDHKCFLTHVHIPYDYKEMMMARLEETDATDTENYEEKLFERVFTSIMSRSQNFEISVNNSLEVNQFLKFWIREGRPKAKIFRLVCTWETSCRHKKEDALKDITYRPTSKTYTRPIEEHPCRTFVGNEAIGFDFIMNNGTEATLWFAHLPPRINCYLVEFW